MITCEAVQERLAELAEHEAAALASAPAEARLHSAGLPQGSHTV